MTSQDTSPLLNKVTRAPSYILIGQTRSANSSHGLRFVVGYDTDTIQRLHSDGTVDCVVLNEGEEV
jgi:hypothetical protein